MRCKFYNSQRGKINFNLLNIKTDKRDSFETDFSKVNRNLLIRWHRYKLMFYTVVNTVVFFNHFARQGKIESRSFADF